MSTGDEKPSWLQAGVDKRLKDQQKAAESALLARGERAGPVPSGEWVRDHRERLQSADSARDESRTVEILAGYRQIAQRQLEVFEQLPCRGDTDRVSECSDAFALTCERATAPSCPREIVAFDLKQERAQLAERLANAGVPKKAVNAVASGVFVVSEATAAVDEFLASEHLTLVLSGDNQIGKSVAGAYAIKRKGGLFVPPSLLDEATDFSKEARALKRRMLAASLLVLDDLGMEAINARLEALILALLVERDNDALRTIVTTNLNSDDFGKRFDDRRILARLEARGWFTPYLITPPARRSGTAASAGGAVAVVIVGPMGWFITDGAVALACADTSALDDEIAARRAKTKRVLQLAAINGMLRRKGPRAAR